MHCSKRGLVPRVRRWRRRRRATNDRWRFPSAPYATAAVAQSYCLHINHQGGGGGRLQQQKQHLLDVPSCPTTKPTGELEPDTGRMNSAQTRKTTEGFELRRGSDSTRARAHKIVCLEQQIASHLITCRWKCEHCRLWSSDTWKIFTSLRIGLQMTNDSWFDRDGRTHSVNRFFPSGLGNENAPIISWQVHWEIHTIHTEQ
jgi:hypothetical protein